MPMVADKDRKEECGVYSSSSVVGLLQYMHSQICCYSRRI